MIGILWEAWIRLCAVFVEALRAVWALENLVKDCKIVGWCGWRLRRRWMALIAGLIQLDENTLNKTSCDTPRFSVETLTYMLFWL